MSESWLCASLKSNEESQGEASFKGLSAQEGHGQGWWRRQQIPRHRAEKKQKEAEGYSIDSPSGAGTGSRGQEDNLAPQDKARRTMVGSTE